jgi:2'-5' RNA ligase
MSAPGIDAALRPRLARQSIEKKPRLFFAVWPPLAAAESLHRWATHAQRETGGRVTRADTIHLTLAFLGEADPERTGAAAGGVRAARLELPIEQARYWPHNHIVWAGPWDMPPALAALANSLSASLANAGFTLEEHAFHAHVTLIRKARAKGALPLLPAVDWPVAEFALVRSELAAEGARYSVLQRFKLE